jgi:hypothetical protein
MNEVQEYHARLDRGLLRVVIAVLVSAAFAGAWYWGRTQAGWPDRPFLSALPVVGVLVLLILAFRRELHVGPYGVVMTTWPIPLAEVRLARPDVLVVAVAKRPARRVRWDVIAQTRSQGYQRLTLPFADNESAERAAAAIRAALDIVPS